VESLSDVITMKKKWKGNFRTSKLASSLNVVTSNESRVPISPPDFHPIVIIHEWINAIMKPQSKPLPFIVLVLCPYIIDASTNETFPNKSSVTAFLDRIWLHSTQEV